MESWSLLTQIAPAVKNGPLTFWDPPSQVTHGQLLTSVPWQLGMAAAYAVLTGILYVHGKTTAGYPARISAAVASFLAMFLVLYVLTQAAVFGWVVLIGLVVAWAAVALRMASRAAHVTSRQRGEVVDLRRRRDAGARHRPSGRR